MNAWEYYTGDTVMVMSGKYTSYEATLIRVESCGRAWYEANKHLGVKIESFLPEWDDTSKPDAVIKYNKFGKPYNAKAGMDRNHDMGDTASHLLGFWDGVSRGTNDMIKYMTKLNKPLKVVNY